MIPTASTRRPPATAPAAVHPGTAAPNRAVESPASVPAATAAAAAGAAPAARNACVMPAAPVRAGHGPHRAKARRRRCRCAAGAARTSDAGCFRAGSRPGCGDAPRCCGCG
ncbi:hypothetical protein G6F53_013947 [Rhizopus delemar]|nr:hypothetical protein G6F53_013947 [Rhizopus delemar]